MEPGLVGHCRVRRRCYSMTWVAAMVRGPLAISLNWPWPSSTANPIRSAEPGVGAKQGEEGAHVAFAQARMTWRRSQKRPVSTVGRMRLPAWRVLRWAGPGYRLDPGVATCLGKATPRKCCRCWRVMSRRLPTLTYGRFPRPHLVIQQVPGQPGQAGGLVDGVRQPFGRQIRCWLARHAAAGIWWLRGTAGTRAGCAHRPASGSAPLDAGSWQAVQQTNIPQG